jgi:hypothetical protein
MICTNSYRLFPLEEGQRRFMFFLTWWEKASSEKKAFWTKFYKLLKSDEFMLNTLHWLKWQLNKDFDFEDEINKCKPPFHKSQEDLYKNMSTNRFIKYLLETPGIFKSLHSDPEKSGIIIEDLFSEEAKELMTVCHKHGTKIMSEEDNHHLYIGITKEYFMSLFKNFSGDKFSARNCGLDHDFRVLNDFKVNYKPKAQVGTTRKECYFFHPYYLKSRLQELDEWDIDLNEEDGVDPDNWDYDSM